MKLLQEVCQTIAIGCGAIGLILVAFCVGVLSFDFLTGKNKKK